MEREGEAPAEPDAGNGSAGASPSHRHLPLAAQESMETEVWRLQLRGPSYGDLTEPAAGGVTNSISHYESTIDGWPKA